MDEDWSLYYDEAELRRPVTALRLGCAHLLTKQRSAWYGRASNTYSPWSVFTNLSNAKLAVQRRRERGSAFKIEELPVLLARGGLVHLLGVDVNGRPPFKDIAYREPPDPSIPSLRRRWAGCKLSDLCERLHRYGASDIEWFFCKSTHEVNIAPLSERYRTHISRFDGRKTNIRWSEQTEAWNADYLLYWWRDEFETNRGAG